MKTKLFIAFAAMSLLLVVSAFAAGPPIAKVRVIDLSALSAVKTLDDAELARLANLSVAENPKIFPFVSDFVLKSGTEVGTGIDASVECILSCPIDISGSLKEEEKLEFVSIPSTVDTSKYDIAIVKTDGTVVKVDKEIIVDYQNRTLNTSQPITVGEGDIILTFVKEVKPIHFGSDRQMEPSIIGDSDSPDRPSRNNTPNTPGTRTNPNNRP